MVAAEEKALWWCTQTRRGMTQSLQSHCWFFSSDRAQTVKLRIEIDYNLICWCTTHTTKNTQVHLLTNSFPFLSAQKASSNQNDTSMLSYRRVYLLSCQFYQASNLNFFWKGYKLRGRHTDQRYNMNLLWSSAMFSLSLVLLMRLLPR